MNWDAIGAIGEVLGAAGVIFTLVYLAVQIRQNTAMTRMSAMQNIIQGGVDHNRAIADNPELAALLNKAVDNPEALTNDEKLRVNANIITLYHHLDGAYQMYKARLLDESAWQKFAYEVPLWLQIPFVRDWYETDRSRLSPAFQKFIDETLKSEQIPTRLPAFGREAPKREDHSAT